MVYEDFLRCFIPKDSSSWFSKLFHVGAIVVCEDIPRLVALVLGANKLLAMAKDIDDLYPIAMGEVSIRLINRSIVL